ncbi:MAG: efflux RND transporter periplasmic adaptor subunit [Acetobacteraceae bacterium]
MLPSRQFAVRLGVVCALSALAAGSALYLAGARVDVAALRERITAATAPVPPPPAAPVPVSIATSRTEPVKIYLTGIGTVQAYNTVAVKSRVDGEIMRVLFREGQDVKPGDALAIIDPRPFQAQLAQQRAARAKAEALLQGALADLRRSEDLVRRDFASRQQVDQQRALVDQYRAQIDSEQAQIDYAETQLGYTTIRSPIEGRAGIRQIDQGNYVQVADRTPLVVITQLQPISVIFTLAASSVAQGRLTLGQASSPVIALAADDTTRLDEGTIDLVDNQVDQSTGTIKLKASFANKDMRLWPGNFVNGRIVVDERKAAVTVPAAALRHGPRGDFVWIVTPEHKAELRTVTAGQATDGRVLIERGLKAGEQVVTDGHFRLEAGVTVEIVNRPQDAPRPRSG